MTTRTIERPSKARPKITITKARIRQLRTTTTGLLWSVTDDTTGKTFVEASKDPEFDACRALSANGISGTLETFTGDRPFPSMRISISTGAKKRITEGTASPLRLGKWSPADVQLLST